MNNELNFALNWILEKLGEPGPKPVARNRRSTEEESSAQIKMYAPYGIKTIEISIKEVKDD